jgi:excisionase family DNA binding protein
MNPFQAENSVADKSLLGGVGTLPGSLVRPDPELVKNLPRPSVIEGEGELFYGSVEEVLPSAVVSLSQLPGVIARLNRTLRLLARVNMPLSVAHEGSANLDGGTSAGRTQSGYEQQAPVKASSDRLADFAARLEAIERRLGAEVPGCEDKQPGEQQGREVDSPYLTGEEAADYLRITMNALYALVERRKLKPLPGSRKYRFTKEQLDAYLRGK